MEEGRIERNHYDGIDQFSGLPEFIIHHIMSFLPTKDVARISLLSKTWKGLRASFPILDFDQNHCTNNALRSISPKWLDKERTPEAWSAWMEFRKYVDATLLKFYNTKFRMKKFKLSITFPDLKMTSVVDKWLGMALESGVEEIDLYLKTPKSYTFNLDELYIFPESILTAGFITNLSLGNCNVKLKQKPFFKDTVRFHCLQKLCLDNVYIDDALLHQVISSCPLIEHISLLCCRGVKRFHVFGLLKLKEVAVGLCTDELKRIDIETSSLQTFCYRSSDQRKTPCVVNVDMCQDVKNLTIHGCSTTTEQFVHDLISKFPYLESLCLGFYDEIKRIQISSHTLRKLSLHAWSKLVDIVIDTPNLVHFHYSSCMVLPSFINAPCPWEVRFDVKTNVESLWLMKLREFLSKSSQIVYINMNIFSNQQTFNLEDLREISLPHSPGVEDFILWLQPDVPNNAALLNGLLWCFHPKIISVIPEREKNFTYENFFIRFLSQELMTRDASCCNFHHTKCWRHFLKDAKIVNLDAGLPDKERLHSKAKIYATPLFKFNLCRYILKW